MFLPACRLAWKMCLCNSPWLHVHSLMCLSISQVSVKWLQNSVSLFVPLDSVLSSLEEISGQVSSCRSAWFTISLSVFWESRSEDFLIQLCKPPYTLHSACLCVQSMGEGWGHCGMAFIKKKQKNVVLIDSMTTRAWSSPFIQCVHVRVCVCLRVCALKHDETKQHGEKHIACDVHAVLYLLGSGTKVVSFSFSWQVHLFPQATFTAAHKRHLKDASVSITSGICKLSQFLKIWSEMCIYELLCPIAISDSFREQILTTLNQVNNGMDYEINVGNGYNLSMNWLVIDRYSSCQCKEVF